MYQPAQTAGKSSGISYVHHYEHNRRLEEKSGGMVEGERITIVWRYDGSVHPWDSFPCPLVQLLQTTRAQNTESGRILIEELSRTDMRSNCTVVTLRKVRRCRILRKSELTINVVKYTEWFKRLHIDRWGKAVPLQAWGGPEGSRKLRFPDFMTTAQDGGKIVSLTHRPPLPPGNTPGTHFC